jgi:hypothetical protein
MASAVPAKVIVLAAIVPGASSVIASADPASVNSAALIVAVEATAEDTADEDTVSVVKMTVGT